MFDGDPRIKYVLGLTQFPSRDSCPSIDALQSPHKSDNAYTHTGANVNSHLHFLWKYLPFELFPVLCREIA